MRLYYPGGGGIIYYVDNADADMPSPPVQLCFYMSLADYATNPAAFMNRIYINSPLVADTNGAVFFSFHTSGTAPAPLSTTNGGFVRIGPDGNATYVLAGAAAGDRVSYKSVHNCAPALSNDGATLYVVTQNGLICYILGLDSTTLATKYKARLLTPTGATTKPSDASTASPAVGPDGDVYLGVDGSYLYGVMLHWSADLATRKLASAFGWDYTPAIVPAYIVKDYRGPSSYLLLSKYNDYNHGVYRVALLDPNVPESGFAAKVMREVATMQGPISGKEFCLNTPAVNIPTASVFTPSEDGRIYRWNLESNSFAEAISLTLGFGEPYVPTVIGPDGAIYTINGSRLFAVDSLTNLSICAYSSAPDDRNVIIGQSVTFTAIVTNPAANGPVPTGAVGFFDGTNQIGSDVLLADGIASTSTTNLSATAHFINVAYRGDGSYPTGMVTLVQRVHAKTSTLVITSRVPVIGSNSVTFTAVVSSPGGGTPSGMVAFWDKDKCLGQSDLGGGLASWSITNLGVGFHAIQGSYTSDPTYTSSTGSLTAVSPLVASVSAQPGGSFLISFTNASGAPFEILGSSDLSLDLPDWQILGLASEVLPGVYRFIDPQPADGMGGRFYRVRSP
jgi:hypothetical protein